MRDLTVQTALVSWKRSSFTELYAKIIQLFVVLSNYCYKRLIECVLGNSRIDVYGASSKVCSLVLLKQ